MISDFARLLARTLRFSAPAAALLISFAISLPVLAKDNKHVVCTANKTGDGWNCQGGESVATPSPTTVAAPTATAAPATTAVSDPAPDPTPDTSAAALPDATVAPITVAPITAAIPAAAALSDTPAAPAVEDATAASPDTAAEADATPAAAELPDAPNPPEADATTVASPDTAAGAEASVAADTDAATDADAAPLAAAAAISNDTVTPENAAAPNTTTDLEETANQDVSTTADDATLAGVASLPVEYPLDWVPIDEVPQDQRDLDCRLCDGRYIDPLADEDKSVNPDDADIEASATRTELQGDMVYFSGGVKVTQGYRRFRGDSANINRETSEAILNGNVVLREPGVLLQGESAEVFYDTGEATMTNAEFIIHLDHLQGTAGGLERDAQGLIHLHNGTFSYCPPGGDEDWLIKAGTLDLDIDEGLGVARDAKLEIAGVPVFYTPWMQFPLDDRRRTGLLWPDFGNDSTGGLDITAPLYLNLAPNYDALYSPRYIEERGLNHDLKLRYLNQYLGYWTVGGTYMDSDDRYQDEVRDGQSTDRWLTVVRQNGLLDQRWQSQIDYSKASDVDYMKDLETSSLTAQRRTNLRQMASMAYLGDSWLVNLNVEQYQSLADDINDVYKKLPQLTAQYRSSGAPFELQPILLSQYSNFDADEDVVTGDRLYSEGGVAYPMSWTYGFLTPTTKYRQLNYDLSEATFFPNNDPSTGSAMASLDGGLYFERDVHFANENLLQTLEPRVYYLYSEYENQDDQPDFDSGELTFSYNQLFRETRFSGHDRIDDANRVSVGVSSQLIDTESGQKLVGANIGQIFYLSDRKVRLIRGARPLDESSSEIAGDLSLTPNEHLSLRTDVVYDPHTGNVNTANLIGGYATDNGTIFNIGYAYNRSQQSRILQTQTEQVTASTFLPLGTNWRIFGALNYSMVDNTAIEQMAGIEYENCCWIVRTMYLRYYDNDATGFITDFNDPELEREHTTQVQFVLKGMGGFGSRITNILEDMIRGYREREY